jgi:hypothetical protein
MLRQRAGDSHPLMKRRNLFYPSTWLPNFIAFQGFFVYVASVTNQIKTIASLQKITRVIMILKEYKMYKRSNTESLFILVKKGRWRCLKHCLIKLFKNLTI